jgi:UDP-N-acetylglucosamine transferase subunit ALG13
LKILVLTGTQIHDFSRMLKDVEKVAHLHHIDAQIGNSIFSSSLMNIFPFTDRDSLNKMMEECDVVITHGGAGSMIESINQLKPVIVYNRLYKYNEHINDHQLELSTKLMSLGYVQVIDDSLTIESALNNIDFDSVKKFDEFGNVPVVIENKLKEWGMS